MIATEFSECAQGVFTRAQALAAGVSDEDIRRLVARGYWHRIRRGAYTLPDVWETADPVQRHVLELCAVSLQLDPPVVGSHETAAAARGIELWEPSHEWVNVTRPDRSPRREGGIWHHQARLRANDVNPVRGLLVTSALRTGLDVARRAVDHEHAIVAVDSAIRQSGGTYADRAMSLDVMQSMQLASSDWPGARQAGAAIAAADARCGSVGESRARVAFAALGLPTPLTQVCVFDERGQLVGIADFAFVEQKTLGEFDGRMKYGFDGITPAALEKRLWAEKVRQDRVRRLGWEIERVVWSDLTHRSRVGVRFRSAFARAEHTPPVRGSFRLACD